MSTSADWDRWLAAADSPQALKPEDYDDGAADARAREMHFQLRRAFPAHKVETCSFETFEAGTGLVESCITHADRPDTPLAWVVLSHFDGLATVARCDDSALLASLVSALEELRYRYIPYEYLERTTYRGKCSELVGKSWADRYFSID